MSAREPKLLVVREGLGPLIANNDRARRASQVNLIRPCEQSREPQRAEGAPRNTPPKSSWLSPIVGTRESLGRMLRTVEVGRREPYEKSDAFLGSRKGHSSRSAGKPRTPGCELKAKAPGLWEDGNKGTERTRKLYTRSSSFFRMTTRACCA